MRSVLRCMAFSPFLARVVERVRPHLRARYGASATSRIAVPGCRADPFREFGRRQRGEELVDEFLIGQVAVRRLDRSASVRLVRRRMRPVAAPDAALGRRGKDRREPGPVRPGAERPVGEPVRRGQLHPDVRRRSSSRRAARRRCRGGDRRRRRSDRSRPAPLAPSIRWPSSRPERCDHLNVPAHPLRDAVIAAKAVEPVAGGAGSDCRD